MNRFNIEIHIQCDIPEKLFKQIFSFLEPFGYKEMDMHAPPRVLKKFNAFLGQHPLPVRYNHSPLLKHILIENIHQTTQVFLPILFCRRNYFKQHKSWGYPIIHFMDEQAEIYPLTTDDTQFHRVLGYPEDVAAIIVLREKGDKAEARNIIRKLNRESGLVEFNIPRPFNGSVVVLRKMYLYYDHGLRYHVNIHDEFLLKHHIKKIPGYINSGLFRGAWLNADEFFMQDIFLSYTPEISRNYHLISDEKLLHDWARFLVRLHRGQVTRNARLTEMYKSYLNGVLLPKMNYIHPSCGLKVSANNPFLTENLKAAQTVYTIDDSSFIYHQPYYLEVQLSLKRLRSFMTLKGLSPLSARFGEFLNIRLSFREKAVFILLLKMWGVERFENTLFIDSENLFFLERVIQEGSRIQDDLLNFQRMQNHLHRFLENGEAAEKLLLLFPDNDPDLSPLFKLLEALECSPVEYDVISLNQFLQAQLTMEDDGSFSMGQQTYSLLILPGIRYLPMEALVKIGDVHQAGGKLITTGRLPEKPEKDGELYDAIHHALWMGNETGRALYFKTSANNGLSYFISDNNALAHILTNNCAERIFPWETLPAGLKYFERRLEDKRIILLLNLTPRPAEFPEIELKQDYVFKLVHGYQEPALKFINAWPLEKGTRRLPFSLPEFSHVLLEASTIPGQSVPRSHIQAIDSGEWFVEIEGQEHISRLGDRGVEAPYNWKPVSYSKVISIEGNLLKGHRVFLKLGTVYDWCTIRVNDKKDIHCLCPPFEADITNWVKPGKNGITIIVGHRLSNHMAVVSRQEHSVAPVTPYGLIGPVEIAYRVMEASS